MIEKAKMKNSKYILHIIILTALIYPTYTFASWWNPASWFKNTETKNQILEERMKELEKKINGITTTMSIIGTTTTKSQTETASTTIINKPAIKSNTKSNPKNSTSSKSEQKTDTNLSSIGLVRLVDNLIDGYNIYINYAKEILKSADFYENNFSSGKALSITLRDSEKESYFRRMDQLYVDLFNEAINNIGIVRKPLLENITKMEYVITILKVEKNLLSESMTKEYYFSKYDKLEKYYKNIDEYKTALTSLYDKFTSDINEFQSVFSKAKVVTDAQIDAYYSTRINGYNSIIESRNKPQLYQPILSPQIQIPKTTYCSIRGTGVNGSYDVMCD